jgi:N-acylneuraminate cytidylyltransferase
MIAWPIAAARESALFDRIVVSTDDGEIAETARREGAETPFVRPPELSGDFTGTGEVVAHAVRWFLDRGESVEAVCCIYATAPFVRPADLSQGKRLLEESGASYAFSVTSFPFPIQRALRLDGAGRVEPFFPGHADSRSQDLEEAYHDAGQFYWGRPGAYLDGTPLFSPASVPVLLPRYRVQDIDTEEDWTRAELMFDALSRREPARGEEGSHPPARRTEER